MPTPFTHLHIAEQMATRLTVEEPRLLQLLRAHWPAFYLGQVAPDVQDIAGLARPQTHFYDTPPEPGNMAYPRMWEAYPQLANAAHMPPAQAVFVAGYSAHLLLDLVWFREILLPFFVQAEHLADRAQRRLLHHVLLTYIDGLAYAALPSTAVATLAASEPQHWLPFVADQHLQAWRDVLVAQLQPGAPLQTVPFYARRLGISVAEFAAYLNDANWMATQFFPLVPVDRVLARLQTAVGESITLAQSYLRPLWQNERSGGERAA